MKRFALSALILGLTVTSAIATPTVDEKNPSAKSYRVTCKDDIGSGFFINNGKAFLTARHVVEDCEDTTSIIVHSTTGEVGRFIPDRQSIAADIVVGRVEPYSKFKDYTFTSYDVNCSFPNIGDTVYSTGHAKGEPKETTQRGRIRRDPFPNKKHATPYDIIVGTGYIEGMSGGPVVDQRQDVIGIVLWRYTELKNVSGFGTIVSVCRDIRG